MQLTAVHFTAMHLMAVHLTAVYLITVHLTAVHLTALHFTAVYLTAVHLTALHLIKVHWTAVHLTAVRGGSRMFLWGGHLKKIEKSWEKNGQNIENIGKIGQNFVQWGGGLNPSLTAVYLTNRISTFWL